MSGNVIAVFYFVLFQICGLLLAKLCFPKEQRSVQLLTGSVLGSVLLQWMPVLLAFVLEFSIAAHVWAAALTCLGTMALAVKGKDRLRLCCTRNETLSVKWACVPALVYAVFVVLVVSGFEIKDGAVYSSQATYGDMSMHLGFITSIAQQQQFPPDYSILPGTELAYPFLSDSISSSLYLWGRDLRLAYMLPMLAAGAQVLYGAWLLFRVWLKERSKTLLAWTLFFLNGGFGFVYFLTGEDGLRENFSRLFHGFYQTPTNLVEENIRWVNMIVDMLLPQRATLFGYAVLFLALYFLYRAVWERQGHLFPFVGLLAGVLPMIHTHSFLALVLVSGSWLLMDLAEACSVPALHRKNRMLLWGLILLMQLTQLVLESMNLRETDGLLLVLLLFAGGFAFALVRLCRAFEKRFTWEPLLKTWGLYLLIAGTLALPQLFYWTFGQATGDGFLRGYFNWANVDNNYLWFYVKNLGLALLLFLAGYSLGDGKRTVIACPVLVIWLIAELVVFQPNVYDNNKLLYVGYLFMCGVAADFAVNCYAALGKRPWKKLLGAAAVFLCTCSALLTIGRELVAEYQLIDREQYQLAEYVTEHTQPQDTILTDTRHNNAIAVLTGRNIHCGSPSYLYFHGLDYQEQATAAEWMYEQPERYSDLFRVYGIDYVLVGPHERQRYAVDEGYLEEHFSCVYESGTIKLFRVN